MYLEQRIVKVKNALQILKIRSQDDNILLKDWFTLRNQIKQLARYLKGLQDELAQEKKEN